MSACDELDGIPKYQVMMFQMIAPSSPARIIALGVTMLWSIIPEPIALATAVLTHKQRQKAEHIAAQITADNGLSRRGFQRDRGNGVRRVVKSVAEIEDERDQNDRNNERSHVRRS